MQDSNKKMALAMRNHRSMEFIGRYRLPESMNNPLGQDGCHGEAFLHLALDRDARLT
jgi:hypothetical protein